MLMPLANPSKPHRSGRKRTKHEDERTKRASAFEMMHDSCTIAGFAWFETLHRGEAFHEEFCAWLYERVRQGSPAVSTLRKIHDARKGGALKLGKKLVSSPRLREGLLPFLGMGADCRKRRAKSEKFFSKGTGKIGRRDAVYPHLLTKAALRSLS
jgi:hypothetical protein